MQAEELKLICAGNLITLRTGAGMTQAELGAKLNYSDKTVSKWERGEAIPDAFVLTQLAEIYGVTVDHILSGHDEVEAPAGIPVDDDAPRVSASAIIAIAVLSVMTSALTAFVILWLLGTIEWRIFLVGTSLSLLCALVLNCVFYRGKGLKFIVAAFVLSLFVLAFFIVPGSRPWQLFLIAVPAIAIVFVAFNIRIKPRDIIKKYNKKR